MEKIVDETQILLDSDTVRHFLKGGLIFSLSKIYPKRLAMLDVVKDELCRSISLINPVEMFIKGCKIELIKFPTNIDIVKEYAYLKSIGRGEGESACMAVARFEKKYIASSNLKDIKHYCEMHGITYITTMDILVEAFNNNLFDEPQCNQFINEVLAKGSKLPFTTIQAYLKYKSDC